MKNNWASYSVTSLAMFQQCNIRNHHRSAVHFKSVAHVFGIPVSELKAYVRNEENMELDTVPRPIKFVWAIQTCWTANSHRKYCSFLELHQISNHDHTNVMNDNSRVAVKK